jgi:hypothetical protein
MRKYLSLIVLATLLMGTLGLRAQTSCNDLNGYVDFKNTGLTGAYTLSNGNEEMAAQAYEYDGPGKITSVRVYGNYGGVLGGVPLRISIYDVDANGRPTTTIQSVNDVWWVWNNPAGYITVNFPGGGVFLDNDFAVGVSIRNAAPWGTSFALQYTGDGEGLGEDHASLAGTSTGFNWTSAMTNFNKNGDFYLIPRMTHFITSGFEASTTCASTATNIAFTNTSAMAQAMMFNTIGLTSYAGPNHFYSWDFGDGSPISHNVNVSHAYGASGRYTVTLTSTIDGWGNDCSDTYSMDISVGLGVSPGTVTNVSCNGGADGSVTVVRSGGATPYTVSIDGVNYQTNPSFNGLSAGTYTLYIRDALGCEATSSFTITEPSAIVFGTPQTTNASCGSADGAILVAATGGVGAIQYRIGQGAYQSNGSFTGLTAGTYLITAKDANNCTQTTAVTVEDNGGPAITIFNWTNISCYNGSDGTITVAASGGSGALSYSINNGASFQSNGTFTNLGAGTYYVIVKDAAQCTAIRTITLNQPSQLSLAASANPVSCNGGNDGSINITAAIGGTGAISFSLNGTSYQSGTSFSGLTAASYTVYAKDVANCITTITVNVTQPTAVGATVSHTNATCNGGSNGTITANGTGGVGGYSYSLDNQDYQTTGNFSELTAGTYTVYVRDENGCVYSTNVTISQPTAVTATVSTTNSTCGNSNGGILLAASGGSGSGYQYSLNGAPFVNNGLFTNLSSGSYYIRVKDGLGCEVVIIVTVNDSNGPSITSTSFTNVSCNGGQDGTVTVNSVSGGTGLLQYSINGTTWQTSTTFNGLEAGTYTVIVRDQNNCIGLSTVTISEPSAFVINTSVNNVTCNGGSNGSVTVVASGGAGTFAYSINGGLSWQSNNVFSGLTAGSYTVTIRDAATCYGYANFMVSEPTSIEAFVGSLNVSCHGAMDGAINVQASGGTGVLQYSLDGLTYTLSSNFTGLSGGVYTVYVKDALGCVKTQTVTVLEPTALSVTASLAMVSCAGGDNGVVNLNVNGGTAPYGFMWSNGETDEDIFHLPSGTYHVTVSDENGCEETGSWTITEPASALILNATVADASGSTVADGHIDLTVTGGSAPYSYLWSNGATTEDLHNVLPGNYSVIVTDINGCATTMFYVVGFTTAVNGGLEDFNVMLYPNPASSVAMVASNGEAIQRVLVYDMMGHLLIDAQPNAQKAELNVSGLSNGNYIVKVFVNETAKVKRLEINR